jgi:hypothetical protein
VEVNRGELPPLETGDVLVGLRPKHRLAPGQELEITEADFEGFLAVFVALNFGKVKAYRGEDRDTLLLDALHFASGANYGL